jgi:hypothetical protein
LLPKEPVESVQKQPSAVGDLETHIAMSSMHAEGVYVIAYTDAPYSEPGIPMDMFLNQAAQGGVNAAGATMVGTKNITLDGYPGIEVEMIVPPEKIPGGGRAVCRIYWVSPRLYEVFVGGPESSQVYLTRTKFLDSFHLSKKLISAPAN